MSYYNVQGLLNRKNSSHDALKKNVQYAGKWPEKACKTTKEEKYFFFHKISIKKKGYNISSSLDGNWNGIVIQVVICVHIYLNAHLHVYSIPREIHRHSTNITACSIKAPQRTGAQSKRQQIYQGHTDVRIKNEGFHKVIISSW